MNLFSEDEDAYICYTPVMKDHLRKDQRPAERGMLAYLYFMVNISGYLSPGDYLLFDGEASFRTEAVLELMRKYSLHPLVIEPSQLHQFLSPCDNHFHSIFKLSYYRAVSKETTSILSNEKKILLAFQCYQAIGHESIISMFQKCGLLPTTKDQRDVVLDLMSEGLKSIRSSDMHQRNLVSYLKWCDDSDLLCLCSSITADMLKSIGLL